MYSVINFPPPKTDVKMLNKGTNQKHLKKNSYVVDQSRFHEQESWFHKQVSCSLNHQRYSAQKESNCLEQERYCAQPAITC